MSTNSKSDNLDVEDDGGSHCVDKPSNVTTAGESASLQDSDVIFSPVEDVESPVTVENSDEARLSHVLESKDVSGLPSSSSSTVQRLVINLNEMPPLESCDEGADSAIYIMGTRMVVNRGESNPPFGQEAEPLEKAGEGIEATDQPKGSGMGGMQRKEPDGGWGS